MQILIADHQPRVRFALRVALEQQLSIKTIGEATDAEDVLAQTLATNPNLALIEWELPGMPIDDLVGTMRKTCAHLRVIVLNSREETRERAMAAGADAFVCMCDAPDKLLLMIETYCGQNDPGKGG